MSNIPVTMEDQILSVKQMEISYRTLHPKAVLVNKETNLNIRFPFSSIISKYKDYLSKIIISKELTEKEQHEYHFKPKTVSQKFYNTTELWDTLLLLNNCKSLIDFTPTMLNYYDPERLKKYLNEAMIIEDQIGNITY